MWGYKCWLVRGAVDDQELVASEVERNWNKLIRSSNEADKRSHYKTWMKFYRNLTSQVTWLLYNQIVPCIQNLSWACNKPCDTIRKAVVCAAHPSRRSYITLNRLGKPGSHYIVSERFFVQKRKPPIEAFYHPFEVRKELIAREHDLLRDIVGYLQDEENINAVQVKLRRLKQEKVSWGDPQVVGSLVFLLAEVLAGGELRKPHLTTEFDGYNSSSSEEGEGETDDDDAEERPKEIKEHQEDKVNMGNVAEFVNMSVAGIGKEIETQEQLDKKLALRSQVEILIKAGFKHKQHQLSRVSATETDASTADISVAIFGSSFQGLAIGKNTDTDLAVGRVDPTTGKLVNHGIKWGCATVETKVIDILGNKFMKKLGAYDHKMSPWRPSTARHKKGGSNISTVLGARVPIVKYEPDEAMAAKYYPGSQEARTIVVKMMVLPVAGGYEEEDEESKEDRADPTPMAEGDLVSIEKDLLTILGTSPGGCLSVTSEDHTDGDTEPYLVFNIEFATEDQALKALVDMSTPEVEYSETLGEIYKKYEFLQESRPWVTFKGVLTGTWQLPLLFHSDFDVSVRFTGPRGTQFIREFILNNKEWQVFLLIVKNWGKVTGVIKSVGKDSMLSSYTLMVMAIDFLFRWCKAKGCDIQYIDPASLTFTKVEDTEVTALNFLEERSPYTGEALLGFFKHYGWKFDYKNCAVIVPSKKLSHHESFWKARWESGPWEYIHKEAWKWSDEERAKGWQGVVRVSDPLESRTNLTRNIDIKKLHTLIRAFQQAYANIYEWCPTSAATSWSSPSVVPAPSAPLHSTPLGLTLELSHFLISPLGLNLLRFTNGKFALSREAVGKAEEWIRGGVRYPLNVPPDESIWRVVEKPQHEPVEKREVDDPTPTLEPAPAPPAPVPPAPAPAPAPTPAPVPPAPVPVPAPTPAPEQHVPEPVPVHRPEPPVVFPPVVPPAPVARAPHHVGVDSAPPPRTDLKTIVDQYRVIFPNVDAGVIRDLVIATKNDRLKIVDFLSEMCA
eukprot:TRINITY_DN17943_c0_g1_i1.p1 TRINITY_DN17943_c0_g1~~TRINITY_DN17943_c0_g1_i1.p1  ORF type:complete len:1184 (+),score=303.84 TRINITY_DN17943_c0_g1_i1:516-3554(+)